MGHTPHELAAEFPEHAAKLSPPRFRRGLAVWAWFANRPRLYRFGTRAAMGMLGRLGARRGRFKKLPLAGGWTAFRDLPAPVGGTFQQQWAKRKRSRSPS